MSKIVDIRDIIAGIRYAGRNDLLKQMKSWDKAMNAKDTKVQISHTCETCGGSNEIHNPLWVQYYQERPKEVDVTWSEEAYIRSWFSDHGVGDPDKEPEFYECEDCNEFGITYEWITIEEFKKLINNL